MTAVTSGASTAAARARGRIRRMSPLRPRTPATIARPKTTRIAPTSTDSVTARTASSQPTAGMPIRLTWSSCHRSHKAAPPPIAISHPTTRTIQPTRRTRSAGWPPDRSSSHWTSRPTSEPIPYPIARHTAPTAAWISQDRGISVGVSDGHQNSSAKIAPPSVGRPRIRLRPGSPSTFPAMSCSPGAEARSGTARCSSCEASRRLLRLLAPENPAEQPAQVGHPALPAAATGPAEDPAQQSTQVRSGVRGGLVDPAGGGLALGREHVHDHRQERREQRQQLRDRDAGAGGELLDLIVTERGTQLLRLDRLVVLVADPRVDLVAVAGSPKLVEDRIESALPADRGGEARHRRGWIRSGCGAAGLARLGTAQLVAHACEIVHSSRPPALRLAPLRGTDGTPDVEEPPCAGAVRRDGRGGSARRKSRGRGSRRAAAGSPTRRPSTPRDESRPRVACRSWGRPAGRWAASSGRATAGSGWA